MQSTPQFHFDGYLLRKALRRLLARIIDHIILMQALIAIAGYTGLAASLISSSDALVFWTIACYVPFDALFTYFFGRGPGKAIVGLRVVSANDQQISLAACAGRATVVWFVGEGCSIPYLSALMLIGCGAVYLTWVTTLWDRLARTSVVEN
ncbi:MAG: RDD family protein [Hyphomicrobium sp.]